MQKTFIIEDESLARQRLKKLLQSYTQEIEIIGEASDGKTAIQQIEALRPDVLFLDIQLPDMTGFKVLSQLTYQPIIIFTTAYTDYAIQAFEAYAIDYLVKPFDADRFQKAIQKLKRLGQHPPRDYQQLESTIFKPKKNITPLALPIKIGDRIRLFDYEDIVYLKAEDKYVRIFIRDGQNYLSERSLTKLAERLPNFFIRVHRSYLVNSNYIQEVQKYFKGNLVLLLNDRAETNIITGTKYVREVKTLLGL